MNILYIYINISIYFNIFLNIYAFVFFKGKILSTKIIYWLAS